MKQTLVSIPVLVSLGPAVASIGRSRVGRTVMFCGLSLGDATDLLSYNGHLAKYMASYKYLPIIMSTFHTDVLHSRPLTTVL